MDTIVIVLGSLVVGIVIVVIVRMMYAKTQVKSAEKTAEQLIKEAKVVADSKKKEGLLEVAKPAFEKLIASGLYIDMQLMKKVLTSIGE